MRASMKVVLLTLLAVALVSLVVSSLDAAGRRATVPAGTQVTLVFDQALSSKTAKVGQRVKLHVADDVKVGNQVAIKKGTRVTGTISKVEKRKRYGVNATMRIALNPVKTAAGGMVTLEPRGEGGAVGKKTGQAAAATAGGAAVLGPIGLAGGYFVSGKAVTIKVGDKLETEAAQAGKAGGAGARPAGRMRAGGRARGGR